MDSSLFNKTNSNQLIYFKTDTNMDVTAFHFEFVTSHGTMQLLDTFDLSNVGASTGERTPEGKPIWLKLVYASDTKIRRHPKIRAEANPFDPDWQNYFAERAFRKKLGIHRYEAGIKPS